MVVNPDSKLRALARKRNWPILDFDLVKESKGE
jgi:phosphoserine phosphatase